MSRTMDGTFTHDQQCMLPFSSNARLHVPGALCFILIISWHVGMRHAGHVQECVPLEIRLHGARHRHPMQHPTRRTLKPMSKMALEGRLVTHEGRRMLLSTAVTTATLSIPQGLNHWVRVREGKGERRDCVMGSRKIARNKCETKTSRETETAMDRGRERESRSGGLMSVEATETLVFGLPPPRSPCPYSQSAPPQTHSDSSVTCYCFNTDLLYPRLCLLASPPPLALHLQNCTIALRMTQT